MKRFSTYLLVFAALSASLVHAAPQQNPDLLKILLENGTITQAQYDQLKKEAAEQDNKHVDVKVSTDGGIQASTYDGKFSFQLGGFFAADLAIYNEDKNRLGNGTEIRSARFEVEGTAFSAWDYEYSFDIAESQVEIKDAFVSYKGLDSFSFQLGHFKAPFSLEEMGSSKHLTFMERSLPNVLAPGRKLGIGASYRGKLWTASAGIFGESFEAEDPENEGDEGWTSSGRFSFVPLNSEKNVLHFGASAAYQSPNDGHALKIKSRPESHITSVSYLDTGKIKNVQNQFTYGIETALVYGPLSLQGEYIQTSLDVQNTRNRPVLQGGYAFASWMITGESRKYGFKRGVFGRIRPDRTYGAIEVAVRYSALNLNELPSIAGGRESNVTLALNWYINQNVRFMTNYTLINNDAHADDRGDVLADDDPGVFQTRLQFDF